MSVLPYLNGRQIQDMCSFSDRRSFSLISSPVHPKLEQQISALTYELTNVGSLKFKH